MNATADTPTSNVLTLPVLSKGEKKKSAQRWGTPVIDRGYSIVPTILFWGQAKLGLTPDELNVLLQLISHWWYQGNDPHPSRDTIAERMAKDRRTILRYLISLEAKGFIKRVKRFRFHKGQDTNGYDLTGLVEKLGQIAPEFKKVSDQNKLRRQRVEKHAG